MPDHVGRQGLRQRRHPSSDRGDGGGAQHPAQVQPAMEAVLLPVLYKGRNAIERMFGRLKDFRRIATRYDRLAANYLAAVCIAATVSYWL